MFKILMISILPVHIQTNTFVKFKYEIIVLYNVGYFSVLNDAIFVYGINRGLLNQKKLDHQFGNLNRPVFLNL